MRYVDILDPLWRHRGAFTIHVIIVFQYSFNIASTLVCKFHIRKRLNTTKSSVRSNEFFLQKIRTC